VVSNRNEAVVCHVCGHKNLVGALMCDNCGTVLSKNVSVGTRNLTTELPEFEGSVFSASGTGKFEPGMRLRLDIIGGKSDIKIDPSGRTMLIGRRDARSRQHPDIDMEDFEGYRMGVSRKHALLTLKGNELSLQDYGSANGTFLNGVRLPAHRAHKIHDGDEVRLGHLSLRIYFIHH
jgi:pSer/pThr/pTyr-binding forkhead associated (FHA) protein